MKTMTCSELGGACAEKFTAATFEEIAELSKAHGKKMFEIQEPGHLAAMEKMQGLMQDPSAMQKWYEEKRAQFEALPED